MFWPNNTAYSAEKAAGGIPLFWRDSSLFWRGRGLFWRGGWSRDDRGEAAIINCSCYAAVDTINWWSTLHS